MTTNVRKQLINRLLLDEYTIEYTEPAIINNPETIYVEQLSIYQCEFGIKNMGQGLFFGVLSSLDDYIILEDTYFEISEMNSEIVIPYTIDSTKLVPNVDYNGRINIIYLGGEIDVDVHVYVRDSDIEEVTTEKICNITFETNKLSYHHSEQGHINVHSDFDFPITIRITQHDTALKFESDSYVIEESLEIPFKVFLNRDDIIHGITPINIIPENPLYVTFQTSHHLDTDISRVPIIITNYNLINQTDGSYIIDSREMMAIKLDEIYNLYADAIIHENHIENLREIYKTLSAVINYDLTNVNLRLFYCFIAIEVGELEVALGEMAHIEQFILYYDKTDIEVSDILLGLLGLAKGDRSIEVIVQRWEPEHEKNWVKIILKNRIISNRYKQYDEYKTLYDMGVKNIFLFAEAFAYISKSSYLPKGQDDFYKALITWGALRNGISNKLEKKLEASAYYLTRFNCVEAEAVEIIYKRNHSKHTLNLLCMAYISEDNMSSRALEIYYKGLEEKLTIKDLFEYYIKASCQNKQLLDLEYFRFATDIQAFDESCIRFLWVNFIIYRDEYPLLTNYYFKKYPDQPILTAEDIIIPKDKQLARRYINLLLDEGDFDLIRGLYQKGMFEYIDPELSLEILESIQKSDEYVAAEYAYELYRRNICEEGCLWLVAKYFHGSYYELMTLVETMVKTDIIMHEIIEVFVLKSILKRQSIMTVEILLNEGYLDLTEPDFKQIVIRFLSAQVIIEDYEISIDTFEWLIRELEEQDNLYVELAVLKSFQNRNDGSPKQTILSKHIIKKHIQAGIMFPWYADLIDSSEISPNMRAQQYFEYYTSYKRQVNFCFRVTDETHFEKMPMKHIVFGLFLAKVVLFYGEHVQYYIEEYDNSKLDIKHCDIFIKDEVEEIRDDNNLYDAMNTIEISRILKDEESLEAAIETYMRVSNKHMGKIYIL